MLLGLGLSAGLGYFVGGGAAQSALVRERLAALSGFDLLALPLLVLTVLAVHEAGHLVGGARRGMRFLLFIVGPFQLSRTTTGIRFNWVFNLGVMGGLAAATPNPHQPLRPQLLSLIAGGPVASLLLAVVGLAVGAIGDGRLNAYGLIIGGFSFLILLVTAIPVRAGGFMSDGMQFIEVTRGGRAVEERQALLILMAQSLAGTRPRDLDAALIARALAFDSAEPGRRIVARLYAYLAAVDAQDGRAQEHAAWLAENIDGFPGGFRQSIAVELALHDASRGDIEGLRRWVARVRGGVVDGSRRALAEAHAAILEGDQARAQELIDRARANLSRGMDPGLNVLTAEQIDETARGLRNRPRPLP
jgi:hypothetical protein